MNTLFKFYFQAWTLWALVAAFGLWHMARMARPLALGVMGTVLGVSVLAGLFYTVPSAWSRTGGYTAPPTLDGLRYFSSSYPDDWLAIQWLRQNIGPTATPVLAEAPGGAYAVEESRIAMATGLPAVMGWTNHEGQWRGEYYSRVAERPNQLGALYQVRDWPSTEGVLDQYQIEYVYVGGKEREKFSPYLPKFVQHMDLVFWVTCGLDSTSLQRACQLHPGAELSQAADPALEAQRASALLFRRKPVSVP
jgi:uncharacterized membrane protein